MDNDLTRRIKRIFSRRQALDQQSARMPAQEACDETVSALMVPKSPGDTRDRYSFDKSALDVARRIVGVYGSFFDAQKKEEEIEEGIFIDYVFTNGPTSVKYLVRANKEPIGCCALVIEEPKLRVTHASLLLSSMLEDHLITYRDDCENRLGVFCSHKSGRLQGDSVLALLGINLFEVARRGPDGSSRQEPYSGAVN